MNTELFSGKAEAYAKARPGYPEAAIDYILSLAPQGAVFADIGAGTGKFTELLAKKGLSIFAVEPNGDMREQLAVALAPYSNAKMFGGAAEATTLPDGSVDVITCAQALHWFDPETFRQECRRIGKPGCIVVAVFNKDKTPSDSGIAYSKSSTDVFFENPELQQFSNQFAYTKEMWLTYMMSHSHSPLPSDPAYAAHMENANAMFDRESVDGVYLMDVTTMVYSERIK